MNPKVIEKPEIKNKGVKMFSSLDDVNLSLRGENVRFFTGNSNKALAQSICDYLDVPLSNATVTKFQNQEIQVKIEESVRGRDVYLIQSTCKPVNDNLMELLIMIDALSRASARQITAVIPHYGYAKQEKKASGREPISAKLVANLITVAGADRVITIDLHAAAIQGFFDIPVDNLYAMPIMTDYVLNDGRFNDKDLVVVSPDAGGVARARGFADKIDTSLAIVFKRRPKPDEAVVMDIVGEVKGKDILIYDDMISTGGTLVKTAEALITKGAKEIYAFATHPIFASNSIDIIEKSPIKEIVVTDTIPISRPSSKIKVLSVAPLLGEAIKRNYFNLSVSKLFR